MPWKKKGDALDVNSDGNPIWIDDADTTKETAIVGTILQTVAARNAEAAQHRRDKEAAEKKLQAFEGIDPTEARGAVEKLKLVDQGKLIEAGKVEELKQQLLTDANARIKAAEDKAAAMETQAKNDKLAAAFASSPFVRDKMTLTPDLVQTMFGPKFDVRDGNVVAIDANGNPITSQKADKFGQIAGFDEAIEAVVSGHPSKASLLKGANNSGTGNDGGGGNDGNKRTLTRAQEAALAPQDRQSFIAQVIEGKAQLVD